MPARRPVLRAAHLVFAAAAACTAAGILARPAGDPPPPLHEQPFRLSDRETAVPGGAIRRDDGAGPLRVSPAKPLILPYEFGDCDLLATVVLPAGGELDLAFRKRDLAGDHGRFALLRLNAEREGPPWATREQALFAPAAGGVRVAAGLPASVRLELRGCRATANVAGRSVAPFRSRDDRGGFAMVVRGGAAEVLHLQVLPVAIERGPPAWWLAAPAGVLVGLALGASGRRLRGWLAAALLPLGALALHRLVATELVAGAALAAPGIVTAVAALALAAVALGRPGPPVRTAVRLLLALGGVVLCAQAFVRLEAGRLVRCVDPRLDLLFGAESRTAPFDALAKLLRGKNEVHAAEPGLQRIVFLGGEPLFEANLDRAHHLGVQATARVAQLVGRKLVPAVFPTTFPHTVQQIELYRRFYAAAYPAVAIVLGIDRWDAFAEGHASARARLAAADAGAAGGCGLLSVLRRAWLPPAMLASPADLATTLTEFASDCAGRGVPLVLTTHALIPESHRIVVERCARELGLPFVPAAMSEDDRADVDRLAAALAAVLRQ